MNNWRAIGYIFLGFGSVFLGFAFIAFYAMTITNTTPFDATYLALVANAHWFVVAALSYVVGVVGYFAGKEKKEVKTGAPTRFGGSIRIAPVWAFPIGASAFALSYIVFTTSYLDNSFQLLDSLIIPILYSLVVGSIVGLIALLLFFRINDK